MAYDDKRVIKMSDEVWWTAKRLATEEHTTLREFLSKLIMDAARAKEQQAKK